jgi:hypothetical protein
MALAEVKTDPVPVTVDLADLERIIFAAAAIKQIDQLLNARKNDPFIRPHLEFRDAALRLESAMNDAKRSARPREDTLIDYNAPLTEAEVNVMRSLIRDSKTWTYEGFSVIHSKDRPPGENERGEQMGVYDRLAAKGCVVIGQCVSGVVWAGEDRPALRAEPEFAVKTTPRGVKAVERAIRGVNER